MKLCSKPVLLGLLVVVFVFLLFVPSSQAVNDTDKYMYGQKFEFLGITGCSCPLQFFINCGCHVFDPTGGGPDDPVSPAPSPADI